MFGWSPSPRPTGAPGHRSATWKYFPTIRSLDRTGWLVTTSSEETAAENGAAKNAIDASTGSIWHTQYSSSLPQHPHWLQVDMLVPKE